MGSEIKKYDLHSHTRYSICGNMKPETYLKVANRRGLNGIAVTDHNTIKGALEVASLNKDENFEVIIGSEIRTNYGELLVYYLNEEIKPGSFFEVIDKAREQDALVSIAHPLDITRPHFSRKLLKEVINHVDAIEAFNGRELWIHTDELKRIGKTVTCGSDGHFTFELGRSYTTFEGDLRHALKNAKTNFNGTHAFSVPGRIRTSILRHIERHIIDV